jgi:hypothetical protein
MADLPQAKENVESLAGSAAGEEQVPPRLAEAEEAAAPQPTEGRVHDGAPGGAEIAETAKDDKDIQVSAESGHGDRVQQAEAGASADQPQPAAHTASEVAHGSQMVQPDGGSRVEAAEGGITVDEDLDQVAAEGGPCP